MNRHTLFIALLVASSRLNSAAQEWISLFDGKTLNGWKPSENKATWKVEDGTLVSRGPRSHLFYAGDVHNHDFKNFAFQAEVKTTLNSNSGIALSGNRFSRNGLRMSGLQLLSHQHQTRPVRRTQDDFQHLRDPQRLESAGQRQRMVPLSRVGLRVTGLEEVSRLKDSAQGHFVYVIESPPLPAGGGQVPDPQAFMERLVVLIENLAASGKVNI